MTLADKLEILPHPNAPFFKDKRIARKVISQVLGEVTSPNFNPNAEARELIRQFSMVNLWFNIKFVCSVSGPYDKVNDDLHLDMANFRQSPRCMGVGARGAGFINRGAYKSTIWTHGSLPFEIVRNPDIRVRITSSRVDKAESFRDVARRTFDSNEFFAYLFPEHVIKKSVGGFTTPARVKSYPEPTVKVGSTGGASAGDHHNLLLMDDLIDEQDLNSENLATIEMENKINWFKYCEKPLLTSITRDRVLVWGTRYAIDDLYDGIWNNCRVLLGYQDVDIKLEPGNKWAIYYRKVIEDGKSIFPEEFPVEVIEKMLREDPATTMALYFNSPQESGLVEFFGAEIYGCSLVWAKRPYILAFTPDGREEIPLSNVNICMALDPAFTYKGVSARTCRTALVVVAKDWKNRCFVLDIFAGYYKITKIYDFIFETVENYKGHVMYLIVESGAQQKMLEDLIKDERNKRGIHVSVRAMNASGDKVARIRSTVGSYIAKGSLYATQRAGLTLREELNSFPMAKYKMDVLDALQKALAELSIAMSPEEEEDDMLDYLDRVQPEYENVTGY